MKLPEVVPDVDAFIEMDPEELGIAILPVLQAWNSQVLRQGLQLSVILDAATNATALNPIGGYSQSRASEVRLALREAWAWLEGAALLIPDTAYSGPHEMKVLSRRAKSIAAESIDGRRLPYRKIEKDWLNSRIRDNVWSLFIRGRYDTAVFEAMKSVEIAVREAGGFSDADYGIDMIARAFNEERGPLRDANAQPAERAALRSLFIGAFGSYKNPHSHRQVLLDDPDEAAEIILLANHLLRIIESRPMPSDTE